MEVLESTFESTSVPRCTFIDEVPSEMKIVFRRVLYKLQLLVSAKLICDIFIQNSHEHLSDTSALPRAPSQLGLI